MSTLPKVLITGGAGFIGSHTADMLLKEGFNVRILDNLEPQSHTGRPRYLDERTEFIEGDVCNPSIWVRALKGVEYVIHLAGVVGISQSMYQPVRYLTANSVGTAIFYETLLNKPRLRSTVKKIIVASSKTIYGEGSYICEDDGLVYPGIRSAEQLSGHDWEVHCPLCNKYPKPVGIREDKPLQNLSVYALSKYDVERLALIYGNTMGIPTVALRYFSAYGPRQSLNNPYSGVCAIFISRLKNRKPPVIFEDGGQLRDFVYVKDIAKANLLALEKSDVEGCYNVGSGRPASIKELSEVLPQIMGSKIEPEIRNEYRVGDTRSDFADISKIQRDLGFNPAWSLKDGLKELAAWSMGESAEDHFDESLKGIEVFRRKGV